MIFKSSGRPFARRTHRDTIIKRVELSRRQGVTRVPTVFVNGEFVGRDPDKVVEKIEAALSR